MKKILFAGAMFLVAAASQAQVVYSTIPSPYFAFAPASGVLGVDDYTTTLSPAQTTFTMSQMRFVGGVTNANSPMLFEFMDNSNVVQNSFSINLPSGGNFIWTITFGTSGFTIPTAGRLRLTSTSTDTGQWFLTSTPPSPGSNDPTFGGAFNGTTPLYHCMEFTAVPEPASMAALGLGLTAVISRRRRRR